jgi:hypothetical protein
VSVPPPVSLYELVRGRRWSNTIYDQHQDFSEGMIRDMPPHLLSEGQSYDLQDVLLDQRGKVRMRGGDTSPYNAGAMLAQANVLAAYRSGAADGLTNLYEAILAPNADFKVWATSLVSFQHGLVYTSTGNQSATSSRPVQYQNHLVFPVTSVGYGLNRPFIVGGVNGNPPAVVLTAATITAGSNQITGCAPSVSGVLPGEYVQIQDASHVFLSRIISASGTTLTVENTCPVGFSGTAGSAGQIWGYAWVGVPADGTNSWQQLTGRFLSVWQNRLILGYCYQSPAGGGGLVYQTVARRIYWSVLPNESPIPCPAGGPGTAGGYTWYGDPILCAGSISTTNWLEIPGNEPIRGMTPVGEGEFLVFGVTRAYRVRGTLQTQTATTSSTSTVTVGEIPNSVGCIEALSIVRSPRGIIFASNDGVYAYDGATMTNLMQNRLQTYYLARQTAGDLVVGGYLIAGRWYVLSMTGTDGSLMLDLVALNWVRMSSDSKFFDAVLTPVTAGLTPGYVGLRWWDVTVAPPNWVKGDMFYLDRWLSNQGVLDASNQAAPRPLVTTRFIPEGTTNDFKRFTRLYLNIDYRSSSGGLLVEATADVTIDASTTWTTLGTISPAADQQVVMLPINMRGQGIAFRFSLTSQATGQLEILAAKIAYQPMREPRAVA